MVTKKLYLDNSYMQETSAKITDINENKVELNQTIFYPRGGGQPSDSGKLIKGNKEFIVKETKSKEGRIWHVLENFEGLQIGDEIKAKIDWDKRYRLMRMHTAAHILSSVIYKKTGALITGNQLDLEKSRIDFSLDDFDREKMQEYVDKANELIIEDAEIKDFTISREEAESRPEFARLAKGLPSFVKDIRIVEIGDIDKQADGGTHVRSLKEVGKIKYLKAENKGAERRRVYYTLDE